MNVCYLLDGGFQSPLANYFPIILSSLYCALPPCQNNFLQSAMFKVLGILSFRLLNKYFTGISLLAFPRQSTCSNPLKMITFDTLALKDIGEIQWILTEPFMCLICSVLGIPQLAYSNLFIHGQDLLCPYSGDYANLKPNAMCSI